jgi:hypothetical protein
MPDRSRTHRPADLNKLAASIVGDAVGEPTMSNPDEGKDPAAVSLGRRGGLKGGRARAAKLSPEEKVAIARRAAAARWQKERPLGDAGVEEVAKPSVGDHE